MRINLRRGPSAAFLLTLFCFFLPFVSFSCPGGQISFTGVQLATGTEMEERSFFGEPLERMVPAEPLATFALLFAAFGLLAAFVSGRGGRIVEVMMGSAGALFLILLRSRIGGEATAQGKGLLQISYGPGYWFALIGFLAALALSVTILRLPVASTGVVTSPLTDDHPEKDRG